MSNRKSTFAPWKPVIQFVIGLAFFSLIFQAELVRKVTGSEIWVDVATIVGWFATMYLICVVIHVFKRKTGPTKD